jgi:hypothetical protein
MPTTVDDGKADRQISPLSLLMHAVQEIEYSQHDQQYYTDGQKLDNCTPENQRCYNDH